MPGAILYDNLLRGATLDAENTITNFPAANMLDGRTATQAGFLNGGNRNIDYDFGSTTTITSFGFARHNIGSTGTTFIIYGSTDNWTTSTLLSSGFLTSDDIYIKTSLTGSYRYYRLTINPGSADCYIGDFFLGEALELERTQKSGFIKPEWGDEDKVTANVTRGQNLAGLTVKQAVKRARFDLYYYTESFFTDWEALTAAMKSYPIYIRWDTNATPFYCWPTSKIPKPSYSKNITGYYGVKLDMSGITS